MGALATETWADQNGKPQSRIVLEASAAGHDLNRGVTTLRKFVKPNDQHQPEAKGTEPRVGADPFVRQGSVAPVEIVVPEDDEAAEFSGDTGEFDGDILGGTDALHAWLRLPADDVVCYQMRTR